MTTGTFNRTRWAAVGAALAITFGAGGFGLVQATISQGPKPVFVAITPCRLLDTRPAPSTVGTRSTPLTAGESATFAVHGSNGDCTIPSGAVSIATNVTIVNPTAPSFLTVYPADATLPEASNLNWGPGQAPTPNQVTVDLSATGAINIYNLAGTVNVIVDIVGYYEDHNHDDRYLTETHTVGGADSGFVFPAAQLTLGTSNFTTATAGYVHAHLSVSGGLACTTASSVYGWLEIDGQPIRSSRVAFGENFGAFGDFSASNFPQMTLEGVSAAPVAAGSHQLRARYACTTGAVDTTSTQGNFAGIITVLPGSSFEAASLEATSIEGGDQSMCSVDADGKQECADG